MHDKDLHHTVAVRILLAMPGSVASIVNLYPVSVHVHIDHVCVHAWHNKPISHQKSRRFSPPTGPWNHADRIQKLEGVEFSAIVDPNTELAEVRLPVVDTMLLVHCLNSDEEGLHAQRPRCP